MFKKRNLKGANFAKDMGALGTAGAQSTEDDTEEPVVQKKIKTTAGTKYSSKDQTEEYERMANEYTDDLKFKSTSELLVKNAGNAFAHREIDTDEAHDARAIKLRQIQLSKDIKAGKVDKKYYQGEAGYAIYAEKTEKDISNSKYTGTLGPIRAPTNVRSTVRIDYNPSLCKDWHDTGYCGFGDSCIYIHDRGDYKSGWELEQEWNKEQAEKAKKFSVTTTGWNDDGENEDQEEEEGGLPRRCQICEEEFKNPVVTTCKHYFCEKCAFDSYRTSKVCPVCSRALNGIFNIAHEIVARNKAEGDGSGAMKSKSEQSKKDNRIVLNQADETADKIQSLSKRGDKGGLEGVVFDEDDEEESQSEEGNDERGRNAKGGPQGKNIKTKKDNDEEDLAKLAEEFKSEVRRQKKFAQDSDWLY